jgi:hypothetical protein
MGRQLNGRDRGWERRLDRPPKHPPTVIGTVEDHYRTLACTNGARTIEECAPSRRRLVVSPAPSVTGAPAGAELAGRPQVPVGDIAFVIEVGSLVVASQTGGRCLLLADSPKAQRFQEPNDRVDEVGHDRYSSQGKGPPNGSLWMLLQRMLSQPSHERK